MGIPMKESRKMFFEKFPFEDNGSDDGNGSWRFFNRMKVFEFWVARHVVQR